MDHLVERFDGKIKRKCHNDKSPQVPSETCSKDLFFFTFSFIFSDSYKIHPQREIASIQTQQNSTMLINALNLIVHKQQGRFEKVFITSLTLCKTYIE